MITNTGRVESISTSSRQLGQATTEFIVAMLAMIPLFFGIYYFARYADVKHAAIQASRYVAFERTLDPFERKTKSQLQEEVRARFFSKLPTNNGQLAYQDSSIGLDPKDDRVPLWSDAEYKPLVERFSSIGVVENQDVAALNDGAVGKLANIGGPIFGLTTNGIMRAEVTVSLADIAHFEALRNIQIGSPGATAIGNGAWNASGAQGSGESVCSRVSRAVIANGVPGISTIIQGAGAVLKATMAPLFEKTTPDLGRIMPDLNIPGSVRTPADNNAAYAAQNGNRCPN
jgi:hypothetical protein